MISNLDAAPLNDPLTSSAATLPRRSLWRWSLMGVWLALAAVLGGAAGLAISGRALPVPKWAIERIEARLNAAVQASLPGSYVVLKGISLSFGAGLAPQLVLAGADLRKTSGATVMALPQAQVVLSRQGMLTGEIHLQELHLSGANVAVTRDMNGQLDIAFAAGAGFELGQIFSLSDQFFVSPLGRNLRSIAVTDMGLSLYDMRSNQRWALGDGALAITHTEGDLVADLGLSLAAQNGLGAAAGLGRVEISLASARGSQSASISARLSGVSAQDLGRQVPPLAFISVLDAPISGEVSTNLTPQGLSALQAKLTLGAGALAPTAGQDGAAPAPIAFQSAVLDLAYNPANGRLTLNDLQVDSDVLQLQAGGHADSLRADGSVIMGPLAGEWPSAFAVQLRLDALRFSQAEMFDAPVVFSSGTANVTLRLAPFSIEMNAAALQGAAHITATGRLDARASGWQTALDMQVDQLSAQSLRALWPKTMVKGTRAWLASNLHAAQLRDVQLTLRQSPETRTSLEIGYHFDGLQMTAIRGLPPVTNGAGYGAITGNAFSVVLREGRTTPPQGGALDLAGSVFSIPDIRVFPATGKLTLQSHGSLTAALSLIDQPPFRFLEKAGRAVDFANGAARLTTHITLPLQKIIKLPDISLQVTGKIDGFSSDQLAAGHVITAPQLDVFVTKESLRAKGAGDISGVEFDAVYTQPFGPGKVAQVRARTKISDTALRSFGVKLPQGMVLGSSAADVTLTLPRGQAGQMVVTSKLRGMDLAIKSIGYRKGSETSGDLRAEIALSSPPQVTSLVLQAGDLAAKGTVRLGPKSALIKASFPDVTIGKWFAGDVVFTTGQGGALALSVPRGTVDMRFLPQSRGGGAGNGLPISLRLERLRVSDGITLTGFQGDFRSQGSGLRGNYAAQIAQGTAIKGTAIQGQLTPSAHGTQIRVTAQNAGAALAQAGIYASARGGQMDLVLTPQKTAGHYLGAVEMAGLRVQSSSILAELLNAISVIGLLDQLSGTGILFNVVSGQFLLTPSGVELREGVATGASLGVTMQGVYRFAGQKMQMQGVISPIYLINGVGAAVSKRGEGVLGFNYRLGGTADAPDVRVNPLSVLLPGFLRNIFKAPPAQLETTKP
ncbi:MAG: DUF3971 domain-containing protein [Cypionkella sp.]|nr:DUF3971 domain-containing protein [Cypionkella sp.]